MTSGERADIKLVIGELVFSRCQGYQGALKVYFSTIGANLQIGMMHLSQSCF